MQVNARAAVGPFGHNAGDQGNMLQVQLMRQPLHRDGLDERIGHDHLFPAQGRRVALVGRFDVRLQQFPQARQIAQKVQRQRMGHPARIPAINILFRRHIFQALVNLIRQPPQHRIHQRGDFHL